MRGKSNTRNTFFLRFLDNSSEEEFKEICRAMNRLEYQISVTEKPSTGIWEIQKVADDEGGMGSLISKLSKPESYLEDPFGDAFRVLLGKYISPYMKEKVVFNFNEYNCRAGKRWIPEVSEGEMVNLSEEKKKVELSETIVQFPTTEIA